MNRLMRMHWPPIRLALPLSLLFVCSFVIGGFWWFETQREMESIERQTMTEQVQSMNHLVSHIQRMLLVGDMQKVNLEISDFSSEPALRYLVLTAPDGTIVASSRLGWVGQPVDAIDQPGLGAAMPAGQDGNRNQIQVINNGMTIRAHYPVIFPAGKKALRSARLGMLNAEFDLSIAKRAAQRRIEQWSLAFAAMVLGIASLFWLLTRYSITLRMKRLIEAANRASMGDFSARAGLSGHDELAQISRAFDTMIEHLGNETVRLQQLSRAVENMNESVLITDTDGTIQYVNSAFTRITGYDASEAIGENPRMLKSGKHPREFYEAFWGRISRGKVWKGRMTDRRKDGSLYIAKVSVAPLLDADGRVTHYVGVQEDVSDQQKMEAQLLQAQKMESLGTLVGGIAHDFNNMLAGMVGNLYMARKRAKDMPEITQKLERVEKLSFRAADMIKQLLAFARKDMVQFKSIDFTSFIKEAFKLSRVGIPENVLCTTDFDPEPLIVECDATQVQQMLMNLLTNARDAVDHADKPAIRMSLHRFAADAAFRSSHPGVKARNFALLCIEDNGSGIPEDLVDRIFEPFFTTKGVGQGSGLGLSMVFGGMQSHKGCVEVDSKPGKGSTFRLYFPLSEQHEKTGIPDDHFRWQGNGDRILVADDEPIVRDTISEMLRIDGFEVETAEDGAIAVQKFTSEPDTYDAVILDVVMPNMGGMDAAHRMRAVRADIPVIFATGYDREHVLRGVGDMPAIASLSKPLHSSTLRQALERLLNKGTPAPVTEPATTKQATAEASPGKASSTEE